MTETILGYLLAFFRKFSRPVDNVRQWFVHYAPSLHLLIDYRDGVPSQNGVIHEGAEQSAPGNAYGRTRQGWCNELDNEKSVSGKDLE
ncbi:unnamed protein product [Mesocestoides corti]|uniref:Transposase n=1 Tax=Mesocestoides corti TaxID=53468 RepID=A0A0R3UBL0_MESCO|nr:unnamed protein product [Mesocestoides corti]